MIQKEVKKGNKAYKLRELNSLLMLLVVGVILIGGCSFSFDTDTAGEATAEPTTEEAATTDEEPEETEAADEDADAASSDEDTDADTVSADEQATADAKAAEKEQVNDEENAADTGDTGSEEDVADTGAEDTAGSSDDLAVVEIDELETYTYPTGLFSIDVPSNWDVTDESEEDLVRVSFIDPFQNAALFVIVIPMVDDTPLTEEELTELLVLDVESTFGSEPGYEEFEPETFSDGSVGLVFGYLSAVDGQEFPYTGNSFIQQDGSYATLMYTIVPDEQFDGLVDDLDTVINSIVVDPAVPFGTAGGEINPDDLEFLDDGAQPAVEGSGPELETYTYDTGLFSIGVPAGWDIENQTDPGSGRAQVYFGDPTANYGFFVSVAQSPAEITQDSLAETAQIFADAGFGEFPDYQVFDDPSLYTDSRTFTAFSYTDESTGSPVWAEVLTRLDGDKLSFGLILFENGIDSRTPEQAATITAMLDSFVIEPTAALPE